MHPQEKRHPSLLTLLLASPVWIHVTQHHTSLLQHSLGGSPWCVDVNGGQPSQLWHPALDVRTSRVLTRGLSVTERHRDINTLTYSLS